MANASCRVSDDASREIPLPSNPSSQAAHGLGKRVGRAVSAMAAPTRHGSYRHARAAGCCFLCRHPLRESRTRTRIAIRTVCGPFHDPYHGGGTVGRFYRDGDWGMESVGCDHTAWGRYRAVRLAARVVEADELTNVPLGRIAPSKTRIARATKSQLPRMPFLRTWTGRTSWV